MIWARLAAISALSLSLSALSCSTLASSLSLRDVRRSLLSRRRSIISSATSGGKSSGSVAMVGHMASSLSLAFFGFSPDALGPVIKLLADTFETIRANLKVSEPLYQEVFDGRQKIVWF